MQRPLRILHAISLSNFGGPAESVVRLAKAQSLAGCEVRIAIDTFRKGDLREKIQEAGLVVDARFVLSAKAGSVMHMRDLLTFKKIWTDSEVDIIHCHKSHDHTLAAISRPMSTETRLVRSIFSDRVLGPRYSWQLRRADGIVVMNEPTRQSLMDKGLMDRERIFLVSREVDPNVFRPGKGADKVLEEFGVEPGSPVAGLVFLDHELDDVLWLLDAWIEVQEILPGAVLFLVHVRKDSKKDKFVGEMLSGKPWVRCMHTEEYKPQIHRAFTVEIILPSRSQAGDIHRQIALEAMATCVPVITEKDAPVAGLLSGGGGIVTDPGDVKSLQHAIVELMSDTDKAIEMGAHARHEATRQNAMDLQEVKLGEFYRSLLAETF